MEARIRDLVPNTLHLYRRSRPAVSLGYFQKVESDVDLDFCKDRDISIVRRVSGGSAIYTDDRQLVYAAVLKGDLGSVPDSYERICGAVILGLGFAGIKATFKPVNDILVGGKKVSGSAQLRRQGAVLQHGTILVDADFDRMFRALKVPEEKYRSRGLTHPVQKMTTLKKEGFSQGLTALRDAVAKGFAESFGVDIRESDLTAFEKGLVKKLVREKYGTDKWNFRI